MLWFACPVAASPVCWSRATPSTSFAATWLSWWRPGELGDLAKAGESAGLLLAHFDALLTRYSTALEEHQIQRPY
ncbi:DUF6959 family protein [Streptomyces sp. NPDC001530]|uniref:DUF6959 family protein n=1 Tax=Streptomyces sp. NPDC001530 TaxID=3364582 RepID=UPI0036799F37